MPGSKLVAVFPVIEVLSIVAVAIVKIPPPAAMLSGFRAPLVPLRRFITAQAAGHCPHAGGRRCSRADEASCSRQRIVAGNQVRRLRLFGTLLRLQPRLITSVVKLAFVVAAADAGVAEAAVAAVSAGGIAPAATDRSITTEAPHGHSTLAAGPATSTRGLIRRPVDGDPGERCGAVVVEAAAVAGGAPAAWPAGAAGRGAAASAGGILPAAASTAAGKPAIGN